MSKLTFNMKYLVHSLHVLVMYYNAEIPALGYLWFYRKLTVYCWNFPSWYPCILICINCQFEPPDERIQFFFRNASYSPMKSPIIVLLQLKWNSLDYDTPEIICRLRVYKIILRVFKLFPNPIRNNPFIDSTSVFQK